MPFPDSPPGNDVPTARKDARATAEGDTPVRSLSSMATRLLLADLARSYRERAGQSVSVESVGGVEAAKRVEAGETFDVIVLAREALLALAQGGHLLPDSLVDVVRSRLAVAVRIGAPPPALATRAELEHTLKHARTIGYSTGPSGVALAALFKDWGLAEVLASRLVTAPPGVPVGALVARGDVEIGFQQRAELIHLEGLQVFTDLPPELAIVTTFSAALGARARSVEAARGWLAHLTSPATAALKARHGLEPA